MLDRIITNGDGCHTTGYCVSIKWILVYCNFVMLKQWLTKIEEGLTFLGRILETSGVHFGTLTIPSVGADFPEDVAPPVYT
ncbi:hypothetical protein TNCV_1726421 [Trichonephila clavipes]|nr:hypothetical protein TNCV_1726421 [Trichonephila clavipes]